MISLVQNKRCWRCWYVFILLGLVFQPRFSRLLYSLQISLKDGAAGEDSAGNIFIFTTDRTQPEPAQRYTQSEVYQDSPLAEERKLPTASPGGLRCESSLEGRWPNLNLTIRTIRVVPSCELFSLFGYKTNYFYNIIRVQQSQYQSVPSHFTTS